MSDLELCYLPATKAIERFKAKTLSPVELLEAMIKRSEEVDPVINAFTYRHFDEAMAYAKKAHNPKAAGPLLNQGLLRYRELHTVGLLSTRL